MLALLGHVNIVGSYWLHVSIPQMAETLPSNNAEKRKSESEQGKATKIEFSFSWKIDNFAFKTRVLKNEESLTSEPFSAYGSKDVQWQLLCFPKGDLKDPQGFGCFVRVIKFCSPKLMMEANLSILDTNGTVLMKNFFFNTFTTFPDSWGLASFVSQKDLLEKYVKQDVLTLNCKLNYEIENINLAAKVPRLEPPETYITRQLGDLFDTGRMTDVTFVLGTQKLKAHKIVLSARSQVFSAMFENNGKVNSLKNLKIEDCAEAFEAMLRFLYTDQFDESEEMAKELLPLAIKYQVKLLQHKCEEIVLESLSIENCAETLVLAHREGSLLLKKDVLDFFRHRSGEVIKTAGWKILRDNQTHLAVEALESLAS